MGDDLRFRGGPGGVTADLTDMRRVADELDRAGSRLRTLAAETRRLVRDGDLLASAVLSPGTAAQATAQLLDAAFGPNGTTTVAATLELGAVGLRSVAGLFDARDDVAHRLTDLREDLGGAVLGRVALPVGVGAYLLHLGAESGEVGWDVAAGLITGRLTIDEAAERMEGIPGGAAGDLLTTLNRVLILHPELTDAATGGMPQLLRSLPAGLQPVLAHVLGAPVPEDFEDLTALLIASGQRHFGFFDDGEVRVTASVDRGAASLGGIAHLMAQQQDLQGTVVDDRERTAVRVIAVDGADEPTWIVQVPGTQEWGPRAGADASDITTNLLLEAHHDAELLDGIAEAMRTAGIEPGDQVMLTGHSQGGIAAAAFAAHPDHGGAFNVTHVVTAGSPIARIPIPADVQVLALEHDEDPVPRLEGDPNPDAPNILTVSRSVVSDAWEAGDPIRAHGIDLYARTADRATGSGDPGMEAFLASADDYLGGTGTMTDHVLQRSHP